MSIERWHIAKGSAIQFTIRHLLISKVRGRFTRWGGTVRVPDGDWDRATVDVAIDASSIDTGVPKRDADLRSANFLNVQRHPTIRFRTLYTTARQASEFQLVGELFMKTRVGEVILAAESLGVTLDPEGYERARFSARTALNRRDFGASGNVVWDRYGIMIGERVDIEIDLDAVRQPAAALSFLSDVHNLTTSRGGNASGRA
jgi:polyisoprenoid-binding protein YceI